MAQDHLTTTGTHDADSILSQTQMRKMVEVPSCCSSRVNSSMLVCLLGSIDSSQRLTFPQPTGPSGFNVQQALRAKCQDFVVRFKDDGLPYEVNGPLLQHQCLEYVCANPSQKMTVKSGDVLHCTGKLWLLNYRKFSWIKMQKVALSCQPLIFDHKPSVYTIAEMELENRFSDLLHLDTNIYSVSLLLICVNLIFLTWCCDKFLRAIWLRIARPMCDGRPFASSPFRRLASRGPLFFCGVALVVLQN